MAEFKEGTMSNPDDDISWHDTLELKLRRLEGVGFQDFFASLMEARYPDDYSRSGSGGRLGDRGCDGYLRSDRTVFACYAARSGETTNIRGLMKKVEDDFAKARDHLQLPMSNWCFAHNLINGLPVKVQEKLEELSADNPEVNVSHWGFPKIKEVVGGLPANARQLLIGPGAQNEDYKNLQIEEVKDAIDAVMSSIESKTGSPESPESIPPVPENKLQFNKLSNAVQQKVRFGRINSIAVERYLHGRLDPSDGDRVASAFRQKYEELKGQDISPNSIFHELYLFAAGPGEVSIRRQVAVDSILSYLFDRCDIFEDVSNEEVKI